MKDSRTKNLWFKRRRYGWGWVPVKWQGVAVIILFMAILIIAALQLPEKNEQLTAAQAAIFLAIFSADAAGLIAAAVIKGPPPRWRWGKKPDDNPDEDF